MKWLQYILDSPSLCRDEKEKEKERKKRSERKGEKEKERKKILSGGDLMAEKIKPCPALPELREDEKATPETL